MCASRAPPERMASTAAREPQITPMRFTSHSRRTSSSGCSQHFVVRITPALFTHTSSGPRSAAARAAARWASGSRTSSCMEKPPTASAVACAASASMSVASTVWPRPASRCAIARPKPRPAPVTTATPGTAASLPSWLASQDRLYASAMAIAEVNGQQLYYEVHGEGDPLLCVHGLACDTLAWIPQIQGFSAAYRTVIFDNRDVGRSSMAEEDYEIADMARDALALADQLELDTFHLVGISMGGAIAQEIACQAPDRVTTLTLAVTFPAGSTYASRLAEVWGNRLKQISFEQHVD